MSFKEKARKQVENNFTYHPPKEGQPKKYERIRGEAKEFSHTIIDQTPTSPEQTLALRKLEESVFWANAAIARNE